MQLRRVGDLYYSRCFAEKLFKEILVNCGKAARFSFVPALTVSSSIPEIHACLTSTHTTCEAQVKSVWPRFMMEATSAGCKLANLLPVHTRSWWAMVEDIFDSEACVQLTRKLVSQCSHTEFEYISVDGTVKCTMPLMGQRKAGQAKCKTDPVDGDTSGTVSTVRGRPAAAVAFMPAVSEKAEHMAACLQVHLPPVALSQVKCLATDAPSLHLFTTLQSIMPNLSIMCLDPVHIAMKYEYGTGRHRTPGSSALRMCVGKFSAVNGELTAEHWGPVFRGENAKKLSSREAVLRDQIRTGSMSEAKARRILAAAENTCVWCSRVDFIEALAAIACIFREEVLRRGEKKGESIYEHLMHAAQPERLEWLFNNLRFRAGQTAGFLQLLPTGTTSNEALHAEMRGWFRQIQSLRRTTLKLKCKVFQMRKLLELFIARLRDRWCLVKCCFVRLGQSLWRQTGRRRWAQRVCVKAVLPLAQERAKQHAHVRQHFKRPTSSKQKRRTPIDLPRARGAKRKPAAAAPS